MRTLCADIGKEIGGAAMIELRRTSYGQIKEGICWNLQEVSDAAWQYRELGDEKKIREVLLPPEDAVFGRKVTITDGAVDSVCKGAPVAIPGVASFDDAIRKDEQVAIMTLKGELVA
ncbi:MAG TPA: RNA-guided pseudouridylation complex pseudouridine synthase subunit Cbf5, partial [Candidatus Micrarchaeota archaeon]|nr:RNA-guided pseudouridylation complex pseudouridine synthase subunit Cbf5 [Candidatus Micrarchaeota archaeon]